MKIITEEERDRFSSRTEACYQTHLIGLQKRGGI